MALCKTRSNVTYTLTPQSSLTDEDSPSFTKYTPCSERVAKSEADKPIGYGAFGVVWYVIIVLCLVGIRCGGCIF